VRDWWLRTLLVLQAPRAVFVALRDQSEQSLSDRAEPVLAIVLLSGMAFALASNAAHGFGGVDLAVWVFVAGGIVGTLNYWLVGAVLYGCARALGSQGSYQRSRNVLAFACVPVALSLLGAVAGRQAFLWVAAILAVWSAGLLLVGVRAVHGWTWQRALVATLLPVVLAAALATL
jgi:hypothetical protein